MEKNANFFLNGISKEKSFFYYPISPFIALLEPLISETHSGLERAS